MLEALGRTAIFGVETNLAYLKAILAHPVFRNGDATTMFTGQELASWRPADPVPADELLAVAAVADALRSRAGAASLGSSREDDDGDAHSPWDRGDGFRTGAA